MGTGTDLVKAMLHVAEMDKAMEALKVQLPWAVWSNLNDRWQKVQSDVYNIVGDRIQEAEKPVNWWVQGPRTQETEEPVTEETRPCEDCDGIGAYSIPVTHPTNPMCDSWDTRVCPSCFGKGTMPL